MHPSYAYAPSHHQPQFVSAAPHMPAAPHGLPQNQSSRAFDEMIKKAYAERDNKIRHVITHSQFLDSETKQQCLHFVSYLRVHKNLFMHTYVHLVFCCRGRHLRDLVASATTWKGWDSVRQLSHHSLIRRELCKFWAGCSCHQHKFLLDQHFVISDDESDLLCHLLYCGRKQELYELARKPAVHGLNESQQIIELLWQVLTKHQETNVNVLRRLRACIYRMSRKSAYLPQELQIAHPSISHRRRLASGADGVVTKATMNGREVVIKKITCGDRATQKKCLELFAGEAILWHTLQHCNIVPFLGVVMEDTFDLGLVSPFFKNGDIKRYISRYDRRDWPALARKLARDVAAALAYIHCHEPPIVHGDLKGDNVLVDDGGRACLGDFGQSCASDSGKYLDSTRVGLAHSPAHWMAPELMTNGDDAKVTDKSDIYSFGCVVYELLSGKIPFQGASFGYVVECVTKRKRPNRPEWISGSHPLWKIVESCWDNHPNARPSATSLVSSLG